MKRTSLLLSRSIVRCIFLYPKLAAALIYVCSIAFLHLDITSRARSVYSTSGKSFSLKTTDISKPSI